MMHYYPHHIGDFISDTANLTDSQCMAYLRMCWKYYQDESPLENDYESIAFAVRSDETTVRLLLKHYFTLQDDGYWHQTRIDKELEAYQSKSEKAKQSAKARWNKQKQNEEEPHDSSESMRTHSESNANASKNDAMSDANQEPLTNNHKPDKDTLEVNNNHGQGITPAASVCIALKRVYEIHEKPPHDISQTLPKFVACIEAGATEQEFVDAANEALRKGKGFAYICATVFNRREEANRLPKIHEGGMPQKPKANDKSLMARSIFGSDVNDNVGVLEHGDTITAVAERVD